MTLMRFLIGCLALLASSANAATLPFYDGFEPPQTAFSNWTSTRLNGANQLSQSTLRAWDDTRSLSFTYAGATASAQAAAVLDFASAVTTPFVRFWLFAPVGTAGAMVNSSKLRLVKLGDAASGAVGAGGNAKVNLLLVKDSTGPIYLQLEYANLALGTTPLGSALTTPITEGTWHYVELSYEPAATRVRVFIDDPTTPRINAASQLDMVTQNFLTCWVGLAGAADTQSSPVTLWLDNVAVAATQTGTAQAVAQHFNEVESGTLAVSNTPPGKAAATFSVANVAVVATAAAAHRGGFGMRIIDSDGTAGAGPGSGESVRITPTNGTLYRRFFWRPTATNGLGSRMLGTLTSTGLGSKSLAEVIVAGNGALSLGGYDAASAYVTTASTSVAATGVWHLIELLVSGVGTNSGTRKLYLDGTLAAQLGGINWTALTADVMLEGQPYSNNRTFQGTDDFDDLRVSRAAMPSQLVVTAPAMTDGACSAAITVEAKDSDGINRQVPEPVTAPLSVAGVSGTFYSDVGCTAGLANVFLGVGVSSATVYFKPSTAGSATLSATNLDYLSGPGTAAVASLATQLAVVGSGQTVSAGTCSAQGVAQSRDPGGAVRPSAPPPRSP